MAYSPYINPATRPQDLQPNSFSSVGDGLSQQLLSQWDLYPNYEWPAVMMRHVDLPGIGAIVRAMGFASATDNPQVGHFEYPWTENLLKVGSVVTPSTTAGDPHIVALTSDSMYDPSLEVSGSARKASYPREGQMIRTHDGKKAYILTKNTSTDPHRLTLKPVDPTVDLLGSVVANGEYAILDNAWGEATGLPAGVIPRILKYSNTFQIIKEAASTSGSELTNRVRFEPIEGQTGSYWLKVSSETIKSFERQKDRALVWGEPISGISVASNLGYDVDISGTEGLIYFAETNSYEFGWTPGSLAMTDWDALSDYYEQERVAGNQILCLDGKGLLTAKENLLVDFLNQDGLSKMIANDWLAFDAINPDVWGTQPVTADDYTIKIGFKGLQKNGFLYGWKQAHEFSHPQGMGAAGYDWRNASIMMPIAWVNDSKTGKRAGGTIGYHWKALNGYSRENVVADVSGVGVAGTGGYRPIASHEYDTHKVGYVSEIAAHFACANSVVLMRES